ncbi:MAG: hypothetical protein HKL92_10080 [Candidatus Eremiobacteraeota bacterium]|nr:hypothetical protein [Candidatus Eremiobacteraeota bacterium]
MKRTALALALIAALTLLAPAGARADWNDGGGRDRIVVARVASFWPYHLRLRDGRTLELHPGTIINPTGLTPRWGMLVRIWGHRGEDGSFVADRIDLIRSRDGRGRDEDGGR